MSSGQALGSVSQPRSGAPQNDLLEKLAEIANRARSFTSAGGAAIALAAGEQFVTCVTCGTSLEVGTSVPLPSNFPGFRTAKNHILRSNDTDKEATIDARICRPARIKSMLVAPIGELSSVVGVLAVFSSTAGAFTDTHVAVLKTLAEVVGHLLPDKKELSALLPVKEGNLLEHPFNPALDHLATAPENGSSAQEPFSEPGNGFATSTGFQGVGKVPGAVDASRSAASLRESPSSSAPSRASDTYKVYPTPPEVKSPAPPKIRTSAAQPSNGAAETDVLDLASNPLPNRTLIPSRPSRTQRLTAPSFGYRAPKKRDLRKVYVILGAVLAAAALAWALYSHYAGKNAEQAEAAPIMQAASTSQDHADIPPAPAAIHHPVPEAKPDAVSATTAVDLHQAPPLAASASENTNESEAGGGSSAQRPTKRAPIVVAQPSASSAASFVHQEEAAPEVHVGAGAPAGVSDLLKGSLAPPPVFKGSQVVASELIYKVAPSYPEDAKRFGIRGTVTVSAKVTKNGSVTDVRALSGPPLLREAAISAVRKWRYKPSLSNGQPVDSTVEVVFQFAPPH